MTDESKQSDQETEVTPPSVDESQVPGSTDETPPEQTTPAAGGNNLAVPSAIGETTAPTDPGNTGGGVPASAADEASPTGGANIAGTPASQLDLAPPMVDESGSNIPAPNLVQPVDTLPAAPSLTSDSLDPALVNAEETAKARVEGRTSDAAMRSADADHIDSVPADINDGAKSSDGGPEAYPFPQGGDVDVASVPKGDGADEYLPALTVEDAVVLGEHELIPERLLGRRAFVVDAPRYLVPVDKAGDVWIVVKTRDEVNATLTVPLSAVTIERGGRSPLVRG